MEKLLIRNREFMSIPTESFYNKWTDVSFWNAWDINIRSAWLDGNFTTGSQGKILFNGDSHCFFEITWHEEGLGYAYRMQLAFCKLHFRRLVESVPGGIMVIHEVRYKGLPLFVGKLLRAILKNHHQSMIKLRCLVEEEHFRNKISYIGNSAIAKAS